MGKITEKWYNIGWNNALETLLSADFISEGCARSMYIGEDNPYEDERGTGADV
jgi:hypothetical protein